MESEARAGKGIEVRRFDSWSQYSGGAAVEMHPDQVRPSGPPAWIEGIGIIPFSESESQLQFETNTTRLEDHANQASLSSTSIAEFVERRFIPEYVATKRSAGRSYFRGILNHVMPPEQVARAFAATPKMVNNKLKTIQGWPYIDSLQLSEINAETIQRLTTTALEHGYSTQTVTHIRNVIRSIFSHAIRTGCYTGSNPANRVVLPEMTRKEAHTLSLAELRDVMQVMRYPEKYVALFAILIDMSVAEICGLQWKYVNLSNICRLLEEDSIPSRTIAIRKQCYRGELSAVLGSRRRYVRVPQLLALVLRDLKNRKKFTSRRILFSARVTAPQSIRRMSRHAG
jgi:integrase